MLNAAATLMKYAHVIALSQLNSERQKSSNVHASGHDCLWYETSVEGALSQCFFKNISRMRRHVAQWTIHTLYYTGRGRSNPRWSESDPTRQESYWRCRGCVRKGGCHINLVLGPALVPFRLCLGELILLQVLVPVLKLQRCQL